MDHDSRGTPGPGASVSPRVVLASMPWTTVAQPSLGLAAIKPYLDQANISARIYHANLDLLQFVSVETYDLVAECWALNEFLFTAILEPRIDERQKEELRRRCESLAAGKGSGKYSTVADFARLIMTLRNEVMPIYLVRCAERILEADPTFVGFTCLFDQTLASVALAKLLKEANPKLLVCLGGYAVQHESGTEVLNAFPWIDCIARGDGEPVVAPLAWASTGERPLDDIPGVTTRGNLAARPNAAAPKWDMTRARTPDFNDWFEDVRRLEDEHKVSIRTHRLPIESSRGCWWGQKHHCTFCGIDEETLKYRAKSAAQVVGEIRELRNRYGADIQFRFADYIFPHGFTRDLLPMLAEFDPPLCLEAEIKANLSRESLRAFAGAGFASLQPGIESFSSPVLRKMRKGVKGIQNVKLLKWGYEEGVEIQYNFLYGFPDDAADDYDALLVNVPLLYHLTPPATHTEVGVTRFAPLQAEPQRFGFPREPTHHHFYDVLFSDAFVDSSGFNVDNYCYLFDSYFTNSPELKLRYDQLGIQIDHWKGQHRAGDVHLGYERRSDGYVFSDSRYGKVEQYVIDGLAADIYALCDRDSIGLDALARDLGMAAAEERQALMSGIERLKARRLLWTEDDQLFGLATPMSVATAHARNGWKRSWHGLR